MQINIWQVLSGALVLSACSATEEVGTDLPECQADSGTLAELMLPQELDGLELRSVVGSSGEPSRGSPILSYGDSCAETSCMAAVGESDARNSGWAQTRG